MCGGLTEMQSRRCTPPRLHQEMKHNMPHAADCCSPRRPHHLPPAGLAIVAALEAELVQSGAATSWTKAAAAESAAPSTTYSSLPIPISSSTAHDQHIKFPAYCNTQRDHPPVKDDSRAGAPTSIFSTSLSPPCSTHNYIMTYRELLYHDFLGSCFSCKRPLPPGKDIYMYRGDRAFCSTECRHKHIVADESGLPCTIPLNQQCVQASSPTTKQPPNKFTPPVAIAILV